MKLVKIFQFRKKQKEVPEAPVTPRDVAHVLYRQMIQRPAQEHDEIVYTFLRLHNPKKHIHSNPTKRKQAVNAYGRE